MIGSSDFFFSCLLYLFSYIPYILRDSLMVTKTFSLAGNGSQVLSYHRSYRYNFISSLSTSLLLLLLRLISFFLLCLGTHLFMNSTFPIANWMVKVFYRKCNYTSAQEALWKPYEPGSLMSLYGPAFYVTRVDLCIIFQCNLYISCIMSMMSCEKKLFHVNS